MDLFHRLGEEWQKMVNSVQSLKKDNSALHEQVMSLSFLPSRIRHLEEKELENSRLIERLGRRIEELKHETQNQFQTMEECLEPVARKDTEERLLRSLEADLTDVVGDREKVLGSLTNLEDLTCDKRDLTTLEGKVQQTTNSVFVDRCRLFRFDTRTNQWTGRGVGEMEIVSFKEHMYHVIMTSDEIFKLCANHFISVSMKLSPLTGSDRTWCYSAFDLDKEWKMEQLAVKFKNPEKAKRFKDVFEDCVAKTKNEGGGSGEATASEVPLPELFKPKPGHWECPSCLCQNQDEHMKCPACGETKPGSEPSGGSFKPAAGSWLASLLTSDGKPDHISSTSSGCSLTMAPGQTSTANEAANSVSTNNSSCLSLGFNNKFEAKTGEEEEEEVFQSRARMYRFVSGECKEKGTGVIKILEHEQTKKARVLMRRDKVLKICCNHTITSDLDLQPMSKMKGKAWLWYALDYSDEESKMEQLAVRFKEPETAEEFKNVFNRCKMRGASSLTTPQKEQPQASVDSDDDVIFVKQETSPALMKMFPAALLTVEPGTPVSTGTTTTTTTMTTNSTTLTDTTTTDNSTTTTTTPNGTTTTTTTNTDPRDDEDVIFVKEDHASPEQKALAAKYKLPANFYLYEDRKPCRGCLGCTDGEGLPPYTKVIHH